MDELGNRPLLATARDQRMVVERPEIDAVVDLARRGLNVLVVGPRGAGATTTLHAAAFRLRAQGHRAEPVDAGAAADLPELVRAIDRAVAGGDGDDRRAGRAGASETTRVLATIRSWAEAADTRFHVMLDGVRPELAHPLFGRLRDELWQTPVRFVVAASAADAAGFLQPPADVFFEAVVRLGPLGEDARADMLRRRLDPADAERVADALRGAGLDTPREVLAAARDALIGGTAPGGAGAAARERARRAAALGPAAERLLAELDASGPASASDPRLLARLGWSRQRAAQVARALEEGGLVTSGTARGDDHRVRRVFVPVPASALAPGEGVPAP